MGCLVGLDPGLALAGFVLVDSTGLMDIHLDCSWQTRILNKVMSISYQFTCRFESTEQLSFQLTFVSSRQSRTCRLLVGMDKS